MARIFEDSKQKKWMIDLSVAAIRRVKLLSNHDLTLPQAADPEHGTVSQRLTVDVWMLIDVLWAVCAPQAESASITPEEFGERLGGSSLGNARVALLEEWSDFFRSLGRLDLAAAVAKTRAVADATAAEAVQQMDLLENLLITDMKATMRASGNKAIEQARAMMANESGS